MDYESYVVEEKIVSINKDKCANFSALIGIDRGCSLTKILFATEKDQDHYNLHFAIFLNEHFSEGLHYLKKKGILASSDEKVHVTGAGCDRYRNVIKECLNLEIEFIDEFLSQGRGSHWLLENFSDAEICYADTNLADFSVGNAAIGLIGRCSNNLETEKTVNMEGQEDLVSDSKFPCLICLVGSAAGVFKINERAESTYVGSLMLGGKSFLGLSKLLLGTNDYDMIFRLASKGSPAILDIQLSTDEGLHRRSEATYPNSIPVDVFANMFQDEDNSTRDKANREDVALMLVSLYCKNIFDFVALASKTNRIQNIYFTGNFFRNELARKEYMRYAELFDKRKTYNEKFLKTGHTGAVGAMICSPEDINTYLSHMKK